MEALFFYFGKVIFTTGVMFLYYKLFLKDKTFHHYNRFYLLAAAVISLLLPLLKVSYFTLEINRDMYLLINRLQNLSSTNNLNNDFNYFKTGSILTGLVAVFFLTKLIFGLVKIQLLKRKFNKENFEGISFYETDLAEAPFSFFKNLFWKNSIEIQSDLGRQILKHEMVHIEQKHSWDKIFLEITTSLFWFNPFFYLIKKEIHLIHEYLADKKALKNSDTKAFAQMLLASHFSGKQLPATSPFFNSNLKKRLTMLKKSKTKFSYARRILALPLLFTLAFLYLVNAKNKEIKSTNQQIEQLVSEIKKDTLISKEVAHGTDGTVLYKEHPELFVDKDSADQKLLTELQIQISKKQKQLEPYLKVVQATSVEAQKTSKELSNKSKDLQKLAAKKDFESPKFKALEKEMDQLGSKLEAFYNTEEFKNSQKLLDKSYGDLDQLYAKLDQYYSSDAFTSKIKAAELAAVAVEKQFNSPEFKKKMKDAELKIQKAEKKFNSPAFQKKMKDAELKIKEAEKKFNAPEFQNRFKDAEENAKKFNSTITPPSFKIKYSEFQNNLKDGEIIASEPQKKAITLDGKPDILIDGKPSTNDEMQKLDPSTIESMHVFRKGFEGKKNGEIHIKLKK